MHVSQIESVLSDKPLVDEIKSRVESEVGLPRADEFNVKNATLRKAIAGGRPAENFATRPLSEAIILLFGRPVLLVKNNTFEVPPSDEWRTRLFPTKSKIERAIKSVGRIELMDHPSYDWVGTGWMVSENVVVTNRHVAMLFAERKGKKFSFSLNPEGNLIRSRIDFKEEYKQNAVFEAGFEKVLFIEELGGARPDMAVLQLEKHRRLPPPIPLSTRKRASGDYVAVIGYPARDDRNDFDAMVKVFGDIYEVKRLAPGTVTGFNDSEFIFTHDCSTLGGNSGSVVIDVATGEAIGLHFGGRFQRSNFAVKAETLLRALRRLKLQVAVPKLPSKRPRKPAAEVVAAALRVEDYRDREGYRADFLGAGARRVPLPTMTRKMAQDALKVASQPAGKTKGVLNYEHFSLVMSRKRKFAIYTAVNVDGNELRFIPRSKDSWAFDPRIPQAAQVGGELYSDNDLDRGHLVRRLDPVWGPGDVAKRANDDTFHYTNSSPQHKDFNQKVWNDLEEYILDNAGARDLKISVFTGPIFRADDRAYRGALLPREFWKVVVMVRGETGELSATAYVLSQANLLTDLEFVFGQFRTFQVPVAHVEKLTGLRFGKLRDFDPKGPREGVAAAPEQIDNFEDIEF
ncbi:MAG TPA: DNA/RNA non-specific endonuclease [Pyrinomonadaceae bacterium]|nr:DNA/RNA non-specific endonuclease [Pyrinomonadaceae bacterium]